MNSFKAITNNPEQLNALQIRLDKYEAYCGVRFHLLEFEKNTATIEVIQVREVNGFILTKKQLIARCQSFFAEYNLKTKVIPTTYKPNFDFITGEWVKEKMELYELKASDLVNQFGVDRSTMSQMLNGVVKISKVAKVGFYYYFLVYELNSQFRD